MKKFLIPCGVVLGAVLGLSGWNQYAQSGPIHCVLYAFNPKTQKTTDMRWPAETVELGLERGHKEAANYWGKNPGTGFQLFCVDVTDNNPEQLWDKARRYMKEKPHGESAEPSPGHGGLNWQQPG